MESKNRKVWFLLRIVDELGQPLIDNDYEWTAQSLPCVGDLVEDVHKDLETSMSVNAWEVSGIAWKRITSGRHVSGVDTLPVLLLKDPAVC